MEFQPNPNLLTTEEAAKLVGISERTLFRWFDENRLQKYKERRIVTESRLIVVWKREDVLRAAGIPVENE